MQVLTSPKKGQTMRTRQEIAGEISEIIDRNNGLGKFGKADCDPIMLEVLLDIRDLLTKKE